MANVGLSGQESAESVDSFSDKWDERIVLRKANKARRGDRVMDVNHQYLQQEVLESNSGRCHQYKVLEFLGKGSFGKVAKCVRLGTGKILAIKMVKDEDSYPNQGLDEALFLSKLNSAYADKDNIVLGLDSFQHRDHYYIVFELLKQSLRDFVKQKGSTPLPLKCIRMIFQQLLRALLKLKELGIIHTDIKPDNIMFVNPVRQPYRVKLIDFGLAIRTRKDLCYGYVQNRYYRAPEVLLGLPLSEAIDMWSLGIVIAGLFLGVPLYPGSTDYDQIRYITETQGMPTEEMLNSAPKSGRFFRKNDGHSWRLQTPGEYKAVSGIETWDGRFYAFGSLKDIAMFNVPRDLEGDQLLAEMIDRVAFTDILTKMLHIDPNCRITPEDALKHPFIHLGHLSQYAHCPNARSSRQMMEALKLH